jgi:hypothetical protein
MVMHVTSLHFIAPLVMIEFPMPPSAHSKPGGKKTWRVHSDHLSMATIMTQTLFSYCIQHLSHDLGMKCPS